MSSWGRASNRSSSFCRQRALHLFALASVAVGAVAALLWHLGGENIYHSLLKGSFAGAGALTGLIGLWEFYVKPAKRIGPEREEEATE